MILKNSIAQLDELHMRDQLTGLYNRFALKRFQQDYVGSGDYTVAILDMDGLKNINDNFGHLAGNHAICIAANVIRKSLEEEALVIRYGGDEFQVLSHNTDSDYWEKMKETLNLELSDNVSRHNLPYGLGISAGYAVSSRESPLTLERATEIADKAMYDNKKMRKSRKK